MKVRGIDFVFYNVTDMKKAVAFYKDILGLKPIGEIGETWAEFDTGNLALALGVFGAVPLKEDQKANVSVGLAVEDVKESLEYLRGKGVKVKLEMQDFPPCHMAVITDPDGNEITLHHRKDGTVG